MGDEDGDEENLMGHPEDKEEASTRTSGNSTQNQHSNMESNSDTDMTEVQSRALSEKDETETLLKTPLETTDASVQCDILAAHSTSETAIPATALPAQDSTSSECSEPDASEIQEERADVEMMEVWKEKFLRLEQELTQIQRDYRDLQQNMEDERKEHEEILNTCRKQQSTQNIRNEEQPSPRRRG